MNFQVPCLGFLLSSGIHKECRDLFVVSTKRRRGVYKALNGMIIRLSTLLSIPAEESDTTTLNKLFYSICNDDDILYIVKSEPGSFVYNVMSLIKQALQEQSPIDFIRSKVSISSDKQYLIFDF